MVEKTGIGKSAISQYATGKYQPKQRTLYMLAKALDISEAWLMGYDVPMERVPKLMNGMKIWQKKQNC